MTQPDDFAFWRGLACGIAFSGCIWIALAGGVWFVFWEVM